MTTAELIFKRVPTKGDSVTIGDTVHVFRCKKLKKVVSEMKKTFGKKVGLTASYSRKSRRTVLTVIVSQ